MEKKDQNNKKMKTPNKKKTTRKKSLEKDDINKVSSKKIEEKKTSSEKKKIQVNKVNTKKKSTPIKKENIKTKEEISKPVKEKEEDKEKKILKIILLLLLLLFLFWVFNVGDIILDIPSEPELEQKNDGWNNTNIINVEKEAKTRSGVKYYLYCINKDGNYKNCKWSKTKTKNIVVKENGINYVFFKAVNEDGKEGNISKPIIVKIDNEAPDIKKVTKQTTTTTIKVKVDAIDKESGIDKYYYKLEDGEFIESDKNSYTFKGLTPDTTYKITIKVVDKLGNEKVLEIEATTKPLTDDKGSTDKQDDKDKDKEDDKKPGDNGGGNNKGENPKDDKPIIEEIKEIPEISLEKVPSIFTYGDKYDLPSSYRFGSKGGVVSCKVGDKEYKDTSSIGMGLQKIECRATSYTGPSVTVSKIVQIEPTKETEEIFDGWITMSLYYPKNSTNWEWRLGKDGETRLDKDGWKEYTGPITVRLTDVENIYIRYTLPTGEVVIIPPKNELIVDINPHSYRLVKGQKTQVSIKYSKDADKKEYRINGGEWKNYTEPFEVGPDTQIDARVIKKEKVYNGDELISSKNKTSYDSVYIEEHETSSSNPSGGGGEEETPPGGDKEEDKKGPNYTPTPGYVVEGPIIQITPTTITDEVKVKITTEKKARAIYYKEGVNSKYKKYAGEFIVDQNKTIYAYYVTEEEGQTSKVSELDIMNIKVGQKPYVGIFLNNDYLPKEVEVTLVGEDYDTLEYSLDGKIYLPYTGSFKVTKNGSIYAKATNKYGVTIEEKNITYLGSKPPAREKLDLAILLNPEETEIKGLVNKTEVTIDYDSRATEKYYRTDDSSWQVYKGSFIVEKNTRIYAYETNENGYGEAEKGIGYLTTGISSPSITLNTYSPTTAVTATINYSRNATVKKYKIDDGEYIDYAGPIHIDKNCTIYAYNEDSLGNYAESSIRIRNITSFTREFLLDKGSYFLLKLNYPERSREETREYKWTEDGKWKTYDKKGILLIKAEYKDEIIKNGNKVQVEDENGNKITFTDHYYIMDKSIEDMMASLFMRWDYGTLEKPEITLSTDDPTLSLKATINYDNASTSRQYKIVNPDGTTEGWREYTGPITIKKNNTVIYAKSYGEDDLKSEENDKLITNIDEEDPVLTVLGDFKTPTKKITLQLIGEDDLKVERVGYAKGIHDAEYFKDNGEILENRSTCRISENGTYTFYVEDSVGNITVEEITITNIDKRASDIDINVLTNTYGTKAEVEIDYGNNKTKQYKIGENGTYTTYVNKFTINSLDVLDYANPDGTLTLYAKGIDVNGNEEIEKEIIYVLDLDAPQVPYIYMDAINYPTVTLHGTKSGSDVIIDYDDRDDIDNYYSIDGGKTWKEYQGPLNIIKGSVIAKSVKKVSGLEVSSTKSTTVAANVITGVVYDENLSTCYSEGESMNNKYFKISKDMIGEPIKIYGSNLNVRFYDASDNEILYLPNYKIGNNPIVTPPVGAVKASVEGYRGGVCEIMPATEPVITSKYSYPKIHLHDVEDANNMVTITYRKMAVKKEYKINNGKWKDYIGPVKLAIGDTIYARSIDMNNKEGLTATYKSVNANGALPVIGYDDDTTTCHSDGEVLDPKYFEIAEEIVGEPLKIYGGKLTLSFYNANGDTIQTVSSAHQKSPIVPAGTVKASVNGYQGSVCDIMADTTPTISTTYQYPTVTSFGVEAPNTLINITYRKMAVQKLYRINDGKWQEYTGPIKLAIGDIIYTKSIDKNKKEGIISSYKSVNASDAISAVNYDGNLSTCFSEGESLNKKYFTIAEEMVGQAIRVYGSNLRIRFYNSAGTEILYTRSVATPITIPAGAVRVGIDGYRGGICEVVPELILTRKASEEVIPTFEKEPIIEVSNNNKWTTSKEVTIDYGNVDGIYEYSLDAENWTQYSGTIEVNEETTIYARTRKEEEIMSTSSYKITKIDKGVPEISLNELPDEIEVGNDYSLPSSYNFNSKSSNGTFMCYANSEKVSTTKNLPEGSYYIKCEITTESGVQSSAEKNLIIKAKEEKEENEENDEGVNENEEPKKKEETIDEQANNKEDQEEFTE